MKIYITKYALTQGIVEAEGELVTDIVKKDEVNSRMIKILSRPGTNHFSYYLFKPFWHTTREEAVAHAEKVRAAKIKSVEKQLKKLQNMKF